MRLLLLACPQWGFLGRPRRRPAAIQRLGFAQPWHIRILQDATRKPYADAWIPFRWNPSTRLLSMRLIPGLVRRCRECDRDHPRAPCCQSLAQQAAVGYRRQTD